VTLDERGVGYVTLNRPDKRNAMSGQMIAELREMARSLGADPATRAIVLSGAGKLFCAGGDLNWMKAQIDAVRPTRMKEARKLAEMLRSLNEMPTPLIGRIHGAAMGGGVGMACVCDVAIASPETKFGLTETGLGLIPATIGPYVVARMGEGRARRVFMSSRIFGAQEALDLGVISRVEDNLDGAVEAEVSPYLSVAPIAVGSAKSLARMLGPRIDDAVIDATIERLADQWEGPEAAEGIAAFFRCVLQNCDYNRRQDLSYDLLVFDPAIAPRDKKEFLVWYRELVKWSEPQIAPSQMTGNLQQFYDKIRAEFPPMNGPDAVNIDALTSPKPVSFFGKLMGKKQTAPLDEAMVSDYTFCKNAIYITFAWSKANEAYRRTVDTALSAEVGFFNVSGDDGEILHDPEQFYELMGLYNRLVHGGLRATNQKRTASPLDPPS